VRPKIGLTPPLGLDPPLGVSPRPIGGSTQMIALIVVLALLGLVGWGVWISIRPSAYDKCMAELTSHLRPGEGIVDDMECRSPKE